MSLMKACVLNDSRNIFPLLCKWKIYFFHCKISKIFGYVKRQSLTKRRKLSREILLLERALMFTVTWSKATVSTNVDVPSIHDFITTKQPNLNTNYFPSLFLR